MKKYVVYGTAVVTVAKEVWALDKDDAYKKAQMELDSLTEYCGNGGYDKLVGVDGDGESVHADCNIEYDDIEMIEDNPDYFECPDCGEGCEKRADDDGTEYWWCDDCYCGFDEDGDVYYPECEEEE